LDHLSICAKNAYGIGSLDCRLDLRAKHCVAIYAPNGTVKSSLRKSFAAWSKQASVKDFFFPERDSSFESLLLFSWVRGWVLVGGWVGRCIGV
jgi:hypothetical protein